MLAEGGRLVSLAQGQWLYSEGDDASGLCAVISGCLRLIVSVGSERDVLFDIVGPGQIVGHSAGFGVGPRLATVRAGARSTVLTIPDAQLKAAAIAYPVLSRAMAELLYAGLSYALLIAAGALCLPPRGKVAGRLVLLSDSRLVVEQGLIRITQGDLAEMTGLSRKSVHGHLQALQRKGILAVTYGGVRILDLPRLRALVER